MAPRKRRVFTPEFKADAVRLCRAGDRSIGQVAKDLDLGETALRVWLARAESERDVPREPTPTQTLTIAERKLSIKPGQVQGQPIASRRAQVTRPARPQRSFSSTAAHRPASRAGNR